MMAILEKIKRLNESIRAEEKCRPVPYERYRIGASVHERFWGRIHVDFFVGERSDNVPYGYWCSAWDDAPDHTIQAVKETFTLVEAQQTAAYLKQHLGMDATITEITDFPFNSNRCGLEGLSVGAYEVFVDHSEHPSCKLPFRLMSYCDLRQNHKNPPAKPGGRLCIHDTVVTNEQLCQACQYCSIKELYGKAEADAYDRDFHGNWAQDSFWCYRLQGIMKIEGRLPKSTCPYHLEHTLLRQ